jgi:hypothetical protein
LIFFRAVFGMEKVDAMKSADVYARRSMLLQLYPYGKEIFCLQWQRYFLQYGYLLYQITANIHRRGDNFNAGFALGCLLELSADVCEVLGNASASYYLTHGQSATLERLIEHMENWAESLT